MEYYAGIDVSLKESSVCVVDANGKLVRETKVASEPEALCNLIAGLGFSVSRIGMEAGPLSQWLRDGLADAGFEVVLLETRHVKAALSAMTVKTDRKDARGIAQLLRMGWYRPVHAKSAACQEVRALLVGRKLLQAKLLDVELSIRGILRGFGLKVGEVSRGCFEPRVRELTDGHAMLEMVIGAMLQARSALWNEFTRLHREMLKIARRDQVCRRLMSATGFGALVAITYRSAVDDPVCPDASQIRTPAETGITAAPPSAPDARRQPQLHHQPEHTSRPAARSRSGSHRIAWLASATSAQRSRRSPKLTCLPPAASTVPHSPLPALE